jgi:hypothetical protein
MFSCLNIYIHILVIYRKWVNSLLGPSFHALAHVLRFRIDVSFFANKLLLFLLPSFFALAQFVFFDFRLGLTFSSVLIDDFRLLFKQTT